MELEGELKLNEEEVVELEEYPEGRLKLMSKTDQGEFCGYRGVYISSGEVVECDRTVWEWDSRNYCSFCVNFFCEYHVIFLEEGGQEQYSDGNRRDRHVCSFFCPVCGSKSHSEVRTRTNKKPWEPTLKNFAIRKTRLLVKDKKFSENIPKELIAEINTYANCI